MPENQFISRMTDAELDKYLYEALKPNLKYFSPTRDISHAGQAVGFLFDLGEEYKKSWFSLFPGANFQVLPPTDTRELSEKIATAYRKVKNL